MRKITKQLLTACLLLAILVTMLPKQAVYAAKGMDKDGGEIRIYDRAKDQEKWVYNCWEDYEKVEGMTYDKKTNTLTLNNVKNAKLELNLRHVGEDFVLNVVGTNELQRLNMELDDYVSAVKITGNGSLTLNKNRECEEAIRAYARMVKTSISIESGVVLKAYKGREEWNHAITVEAKNANAVSISGISSGAYHTEEWAQFENCGFITKRMVYECTFDGKDEEYVVYTEEGWSGYDVLKKIGKTTDGTAVCRAEYWANDTDKRLQVKTENSFEAYVDRDGFWTWEDALVKDGKKYGLERDWEARKCKIYDLEEVKSKDGSWMCGSYVEEVPMKEDDCPEGYDRIVEGYNKATLCDMDIFTVAKAAAPTVKAAKNGVTVKWKAVSGAKGYEVRYSTSKKMTGAWVQELAASKKTVKIENLKSKVTVYVQVRAFEKDANGNKIYGAWSTAKSAKTK